MVRESFIGEFVQGNASLIYRRGRKKANSSQEHLDFLIYCNLSTVNFAAVTSSPRIFYLMARFVIRCILLSQSIFYVWFQQR